MPTEKKITGYPSIDKPWLKYYSEEAINAPLPECTIYEYLWENNKDHLDDIALNYFGKKITYRKLFENIDNTANALSGFGIAEGDSVMFFTLNTPECIYCIYALNKIGAEIDFEYLNLKPKDIERSCAENSTKLILSVDLFADVLSKCELNVPVVQIQIKESLPLFKRLFLKSKHQIPDFISYKDLLKEYKNSKDTDIHPNGTFIVHTGGTTGVPKGVALTNKNLNAVAVQYKYSSLDLKRQDKMLNIAPPFVAFGLSLTIHSPLCIGMCVCLSPDPNPKTTDKFFYYYKPNHYLGGHAHLNCISNSKYNTDLSFVKTVAYGGESIPRSDCERFLEFFRKHGSLITHLSPGYGMSELASTAVTSGGYNVFKNETVGIPLVYTNIKIVDTETFSEKPFNEIGEIYISSPSMMREYKNNPEETKNVFYKDENETIWIKTGDLGKVDEDGFVSITGRIKRIKLVKDSGGTIFKLFPDYIEKIIAKLSGVKSCAVVTKQIDEADNKAVVFIQKGDVNISKEMIIEHCKKELPEYLIPIHILFVESIPTTIGGKIDYRALEKQAEEMK